ncbi:MAG: gliding motility-associated C-terminal domain-containing protein [Flavobacteriales bacterium]
MYSKLVFKASVVIRCTNTHFTVFNKWGDVVFVSYDPSDVWLGDANGSGYFVPDGVYFWQARIRYVTTTPAELHEGHLIILR